MVSSQALYPSSVANNVIAAKVFGSSLPPSVLASAGASSAKAAAIPFVDKTPLWVQKSIFAAAATTSSSQPLFVPSTLATSLGHSVLGGRPMLFPSASMMPTSSTVASAAAAAAAAAGVVSSAAKGVAVRPPPTMMYQIMAPSSGISSAHPLLTPVLTMLKSPPGSGIMSASPMLFSSPPMSAPTLGGLQQAVIKSAQFPGVVPEATTEMVTDASSDVPVKRVFAEPATGQTISFSDFPTNAMAVNSGLQPRTLASIPPSELTLHQVELKAFAEDFKTRRIRLGFTQGSVGQSLAEKGYNNFAQSTISRFEQMQLSPSNAATIRVILEKWLLEAECPESAPTPADALLPSQLAGRKRKKRAVFTPQTRSVLEEFFAHNPRPNRQAIEGISLKLDLLPEEVRVWFCNKRQKTKTVHRSSFDRESSISSSGVSSPVPSEGSMSQKRRSPSPPKTPFTIEELSKSSTVSTMATMSAMATASAMATSPTMQISASAISRMGIMASATQSIIPPILFGGASVRQQQQQQVFSNSLLPAFIASTQTSV